MTPERWARLEPLIDEALDVAPERRAAYYDRAMPDDAILRAELEQLVVECERCDSLLDVGAGIHFAELLGGDSAAPPHRRRRVATPSDTRRTYAMEREFGGGGMSRVFVARRSRARPTVVIKVLTPEWPPGISAERFEREIKTAASCSRRTSSRSSPQGATRATAVLHDAVRRGRSLRERLYKRPPLSMSGTLMSILGDVARAVRSARTRHRPSRHQAGKCCSPAARPSSPTSASPKR